MFVCKSRKIETNGCRLKSRKPKSSKTHSESRIVSELIPQFEINFHLQSVIFNTLESNHYISVPISLKCIINLILLHILIQLYFAYPRKYVCKFILSNTRRHGINLLGDIINLKQPMTYISHRVSINFISFINIFSIVQYVF